jgi:hypothetical protein
MEVSTGMRAEREIEVPMKAREHVSSKVSLTGAL